jgi:hypothetical protein
MVSDENESMASVTVFTSFEEAEREACERMWRMTPEARLELLETIRAQYYPDGLPPELQPVVECFPL